MIFIRKKKPTLLKNFIWFVLVVINQSHLAKKSKGRGSGFQTAILAQLAKKVYTIEVYPELSKKAQKLLNKLGYQNIKYKLGDGKLGWQEFAPFDKIIVTAAASEIPSLLVEQLKTDGKMILPLETNRQQYLVLLRKLVDNRVELKKLVPVRFVALG
ncbi:protein-L-isoaspartate O-methyltransferase family protein [endosymbiont GvMRE of Glomus versiforme]|uniref:protein-L-isoaspartate O-methyltransferase family protein n=1 Tax=endosymbiont GvMRE of Glomus versiforme TaxID=2039283 RepID=UPI000ED460AF|nr:hypothetical protein [endosymbiont GvMRE of Glomus versiforme]RHZ35728.1 Protein-L-isoaspartate O-methyltransferase [endosymbiont GvMRE of Glomus versiforme]RHZ35748.1 Protein-L-isoaspartate O-methyltransferase [endosymbiont GvMRE of Glomus versiforme]